MMSGNGSRHLHEPPPDESKGPMLLKIITPTFAIALLLFSARITTRIRIHRRLWWADYVLSCAVVLTVVSYGFLVAAVKRGFGRHIFYLSENDAINIGLLGFIPSLFWISVTMLVRTSMSMMLLRIKSERLWQWGMYTLIGVQLATGLAATIFDLAICRPIEANWNPSIPGARCGKAQLETMIYVTSILFVVSDVIYSLLPLTFIYKIRRRTIEKVTIALLMSLGILASAAAIVKITKAKSYVVAQDPTWNSVSLAIWAWTEAYIGIIAACAPCLNGPLQRIMKRFGLLRTMRRGGQAGNMRLRSETADKSKGIVSVQHSVVNSAEKEAVAASEDRRPVSLKDEETAKGNQVVNAAVTSFREKESASDTTTNATVSPV